VRTQIQNNYPTISKAARLFYEQETIVTALTAILQQLNSK